MNTLYYYDDELGYMPSIPLPFYGRMKWWHFHVRFVCGDCRKGFWSENEYENHYALTHIPSLEDE